MQPDDPLLVEKIIHERKAISSRFNSGVGVATSSNQTPFCSGYGQNKRMGTSKRIRSTSTSSGGLGGDYLPLPFTKLESLKLDLNTPTHLPVVEFIMSFTQVHSLLLGKKFWRFTRSTSIGRGFTLHPFVKVLRNFAVPPIDLEVDVKSVSKFRGKSLLTLQCTEPYRTE